VREADGGQRGTEAVHERHVVEADDGDVVWAAHAELVEGGVAAHREHVVGDHDGGEAVGGGEQFPAAAVPLLHRVGGGVNDPGLGYLELVGGHAGVEAAQPRRPGGGVLRPGDVTDPLVTE